MQDYLNNRHNRQNDDLQKEIEDLLLWRRTHGVNKVRDFLPSIQNETLRELIDSLVNPTNINGNSNDYYQDIHNKLEEIENLQLRVANEISDIKYWLNQRRS